VVSFAVDGVHPNDISVMLNNYGIATRTGHHCAEHLMNTLGVSGTCRASLAFYNTIEEVEFFVKSLKRILNILR
jgi:cysteine desulfurase/selenocysteine lyase